MLFTHYYGHALSLAVRDSVRNVKSLSSNMDTTSMKISFIIYVSQLEMKAILI